MANDVFESIDELLEAHDGDFSAGVASESMWSATLRLTLTDPPNAPSRSITFYAVAGSGPAEVAHKVLGDAREFLDSGD